MNGWNLESETKLSPCRRNVFAFAALLIIIFSIYSNTFDASWHFDDTQNILERKVIHLSHFTWPEIKSALFWEKGENYGKPYRPVANFTLALNYYFGKLDVFGYHLVNTSIHVVASFFLFLFIYSTLNLPLLRPTYGKYSYFVALLAAVLWAINPVQIQAVTYIVQRMASMAAMFYIMGMYFFVKGRTSELRGLAVRYYSISAACALLAFGSKENAAMLPFSILLFDIFLIQGVTQKNIKRNFLIFCSLIIIPLALMAILNGPSMFNPQRIFKSYEISRSFSMMERLLTEPRIILLYVSLLLYPMPHRLAIIHDITVSHSLFDPPQTIVAILLIFAVLALCILRCRRWPLISYCMLFFFLNHLIEGSGFGLELIFEHRNYLPSMLLFIPPAILLVKGLEHFAQRRPMQIILAAFMVLVVIGLANSTFLRNYDWKTDGTLWTDTAKKATDLIRPYMNLGNYYSSHNMFEKALSSYMEGATKKVVNRKQDLYLIQYNIGLMHHKMGHVDEALKYYQKTVEDYPYADAYNNIGLMLLKKHFPDKAEQAFLQAIKCNKDHIKAHKNLALLTLKKGQIQEALVWLDKAMQISPDHPGILGAAGYGYRLYGSFGKAFTLFEKTIRSEPYDAKAHLYLAEIFFKRKMFDQAEKHVEEFTRREKRGDLRGYVMGTYREEYKIDIIRPYKEMVMQMLSVKYHSESSYINEKAVYLNETILSLQGTP